MRTTLEITHIDLFRCACDCNEIEDVVIDNVVTIT